ncbi:hypothetical protein [Cryobacterium breve]|uniref:hypothetical protein n=1 Tax=Cryobacterium breve TaxID=1259258 RepID=UPI003D7C2DD0
MSLDTALAALIGACDGELAVGAIAGALAEPARGLRARPHRRTPPARARTPRRRLPAPARTPRLTADPTPAPVSAACARARAGFRTPRPKRL